MRTTDEILTEMVEVQTKFPVLNGLDSTSDTSFFLNLKKYFALLCQMLIGEVEAKQAGIEQILASATVGSIAWYVSQVRGFQFGDTVSVINGRVAYDVIDEQKRIIVQATASEDFNTGRLTIRAAKASESSFVALTTDELEALKQYVGKVKYAGVVVDVVSIEADQVKIVGVAKLDRQVLKLDGSLLSDPSKFPVTDAIRSFLASLPYNSVINNTELTDRVQAVKGVKDFTISSSFTRRPVSDTWVPYTREVTSLAGHANLHNDSLINYTY